MVNGLNDEETSLIFEVVQLTITVIGLVLNILTCFVLRFCRSGFGPLVYILLQHQTVADVLVCAICVILLVQPVAWTTGNPALDALICHVWHSQTLYWGVVNVSIWNLVLLSVERYIAVVHPFTHRTFIPTRAVKCILILHFLVFGVLMLPSYFQSSLVDGECKPEYFFKSQAFKTFMVAYSVIIFLITYMVPCVIFVILYGRIILLLRKRQREANFGRLGNRTFGSANTQLTKTAIAVTLVLILCLGFDMWYYVLGHTGVFDYILGSPAQKTGVFFAVLNSCVNPVIYTICMPSFRSSVKRTFCCKNQLGTSSIEVDNVRAENIYTVPSLQ